MSLKQWLNNGWLISHKTTPQEINDLLGVAERDLNDAKTTGLSADWRLNIAYNAMLQTATAALATAGYRAGKEAHHYRVIQSLQYTIGLDTKTITVLDTFRKKRNVGEYERAGTVSEQEAKEMIDLAEQICKQVIEWLKGNYPELMY